jgi:hypothetical protein
MFRMPDKIANSHANFTGVECGIILFLTLSFVEIIAVRF